MADLKPSLLGSISPWSISRSSTPTVKPAKEEVLRPSSGQDHIPSLRPSPSLRRYPRDCPPLKTRWYYAVDVPKRKPFTPEVKAEETVKPAAVPKKFIPFSASDSQAIENAFQSLDDDDDANTPSSSAHPTSTRVPVNEDYLFDVHIEARELEPAYWLGPIYEVRRGSWFYQEGSSLRPCDENLANQLEEGYLKLAPWRSTAGATPGHVRSTSEQRRSPARPSSTAPAATGTESSTNPNSPRLGAAEARKDTTGTTTYRLFGAHMSTTVTYQDSSTAYLTFDDFVSRMSSTVYGLGFGGLSGSKVVRGFVEAGKAAEASTATEDRRKSTQPGPSSSEATRKPEEAAEKASETPSAPRRTALERQLSSLAGLPTAPDTGQAEKTEEEEARQREEKEMEDAREKDGDDQNRQIDHLVLVTHGVGQRLGLRLDSVNFVHDVNTMRKTMKAVYESAPDLQALSDTPKNCRIQILPICWRHLLDFPRQSLKENRREQDLGDVELETDYEYPSLQDITVEGVPAVRNLITDLAMDVLLYQSAYREHIASIVRKEANRVYGLFKQRTGFAGRVSLCGHSLGSAILFDILCRQESEAGARPHRVSSRSSGDIINEVQDLSLDFDCDNFFCLGSPIALFQMLKGRTVAGRTTLNREMPPPSPFDPDHIRNDPFNQPTGQKRAAASLIPITTSSPKCAEFYNIFHPTDPIAYRIEPLISPAMAQLKSQPLPFTKKGFAAGGIAAVTSSITQQLSSGWSRAFDFAATSLINRTLGISGDDQALAGNKQQPPPLPPPSAPARLPGPMRIPTSDLYNMPVADAKKQQDLADAAKSLPDSSSQAPTLIDDELDTLFAGFQKRRQSEGTPPSDEPALDQASHTEHEKARNLKREEAKVKALNSNGRVDYHIQEGMFDVSLLASIASHLSYWADEDVSHFMVGQMLKRGDSKRKEI